MSTHLAGNILADRIAQFKQIQAGLSKAAQVYVPTEHAIIIKPSPSSWDALVPKTAAGNQPVRPPNNGTGAVRSRLRC